MEKKIIIAAMLILTIGCTKEEEETNTPPPPPAPIVWYDINGKWVNPNYIMTIDKEVRIYPPNGGFGSWDTYKWTQIDNNNGVIRRRYLDTIFVQMLNDTICNFRCTYPGDSLPKTLQFMRN